MCRVARTPIKLKLGGHSDDNMKENAVGLISLTLPDEEIRTSAFLRLSRVLQEQLSEIVTHTRIFESATGNILKKRTSFKYLSVCIGLNNSFPAVSFPQL